VKKEACSYGGDMACLATVNIHLTKCSELHIKASVAIGIAQHNLNAIEKLRMLTI
jgi:hypothetical protein